MRSSLRQVTPGGTSGVVGGVVLAGGSFSFECEPVVADAADVRPGEASGRRGGRVGGVGAGGVAVAPVVGRG
jgi:hypothetical protein